MQWTIFLDSNKNGRGAFENGSSTIADSQKTSLRCMRTCESGVALVQHNNKYVEKQKENPVVQKNFILSACPLQYKAKKATKLNQHVSANHPPFLRHERKRHTTWELCLGPIKQWHQALNGCGAATYQTKK